MPRHPAGKRLHQASRLLAWLLLEGRSRGRNRTASDRIGSRLDPTGNATRRCPPAGGRCWEEVIPFFAFSPEVRKILYTTSAIESLPSEVRKAIRNKRHSPSDEVANKLIYLALRNIVAKWENHPRNEHAANHSLEASCLRSALRSDNAR